MLRRIGTILVPTLIAVTILAYMLLQVWDSLAEAIAVMIPQYLLIAIVICSGTWFLRGWRYQYILKGLTIRIELLPSTAYILLSQTANLVVPARLGDLVRMFILKDQGKATYSQGLSSIVVERIFDVIMVALLGFVCLNFVFNVPGWFYTLILVPLVGGAIFLLLLYSMGMLESDNRYVRIVFTLLNEIRQASLNLQSLAVLSVSSLIIWLLDVAVCMVVIAMFRETVSLPLVILAIAIGNLVKAVPVTPGGIGTYEAALAITFSLAGMPAVTATLIAILDHLVKNGVTLAGGIASIYFFGRWVVRVMQKAFRVKIGEEESGGDGS